MARELDSFLTLQVFDIFLIEGFAVCIHCNDARNYRDARHQYCQRNSLAAANLGLAVRSLLLKCVSHDSLPSFLKTNQKSIWPFTTSLVTSTRKFVFILTSLLVKLAINSVSVEVSSGFPFSLKRGK